MTKRPGNDNKRSAPGRLRIVAGNWRSRLLQIADVPGLRPTPERVRETLFNWLASRVEGARCLDLFAGTGALGLEALSRGAASAVFVERSAQAVRALERNVQTLAANGATIVHADARNFLMAAEPGAFDVVFMDPPFAEDVLGETCRLVDERGMLAANARVYIEQDRSQPEPRLPPGWRTLRRKTAGNVRYSLLETGSRTRPKGGR